MLTPAQQKLRDHVRNYLLLMSPSEIEVEIQLSADPDRQRFCREYLAEELALQIRDAPRVKSSTPWGAADRADIVAHGIVSVSTPSHGGLWLAQYRDAEIRDQITGWDTWAGGSWYEEDCDAAIVPCFYPEHFEPRTVFHAVQQVLAMGKNTDGKKWATAAEWLQTSMVGRVAIARCEQYRSDNANKYERSGCGSGVVPGVWWSTWRRISDGQTRQVYASIDDLYGEPKSDAELDAIDAQHRPKVEAKQAELSKND